MQGMKVFKNPSREEWRDITARMSVSDDEINGVVQEILRDVASGGDAALRDITLRIDGMWPDSLMVTEEEYVEAESLVSEQVKRAVDEARENVMRFHQAQSFEPIDVEIAQGIHCCQRAVAIDTVGLYVPGGSAPLFSTVIMLAVPARVAGCRRVVMCTPMRRDGKVATEVLYTARRCGVDAVYKLGGAQAVAAMAYGTESVPRVDKIFGPGNRYVMKAKQLVSAVTAIDMPAGPSEVMVMADETAEPSFVAADMLSQAEHGADSQAVLVCNNELIAKAVAEEIARQKALLPRLEVVNKSLECARMVVFDDKEDMIDFANSYAAEHLIISMREPWNVAAHITAAGSIFVGNYSPESAGDYASGTNHTLPTSGWARSCSGVNLDSFVRKITYQELAPEGLNALSNTIMTMAEAEGLDAHANAVRVRLEKMKNNE